MRLILLASARADLEWFRQYYGRVFPEGAGKARERLAGTLALLREHPRAGQEAEAPGARRIPVARTPFILEYRIRLGRIEILHVRDSRSDRAELDPKQET